MAAVGSFTHLMTFSRDTWLQYLWRRFRFGFRLPHPRYLVENQMLPPRIQGVGLRRYEDKDFDACRALHDLNATDRFPQDSAFDQIRYLRSSSRTKLVAEVNGEVIGCGGYQLHHPDFVTFVYGLVHPRCQGAGIGRLLVFARVAQLPLIKTETCVQIATVKRAMSYYEQFAFQSSGLSWKDSKGVEHPHATLCLNAYIIAMARRYLETLGVPFPDLRDEPPTNPQLVREANAEDGQSAVCSGNSLPYEQ